MDIVVRAVLPDGTEPTELPSYTELAVSRVVSISFWPNTDPEDDSPGEVRLTVELDDDTLREATERARYFGHLARCAAMPSLRQPLLCDCR